MTRFRYRAAAKDGSVTMGQIEASGPETARNALRNKGLLPLSVAPAGAWMVAISDRRIGSRRRDLPPKELAIFTRQMATLLNGGVQVETALATLAQNTTPRLGAICQRLHHAILDGASLSAALQDKALGLDRFYLTSIQAGERAGRLASVLAYLADHAEDRLRNRQTVVLALIYPVILILVSIAIVVGLLVFLLPDIVRVFAARGADLPPLTRIMIGLSDVLVAHAVTLVVTLAMAITAITFAARRPQAQQAWHSLLWRSGLARQVTLVQFSGTLATLTQSGVPLADALRSATATVGNLAARDALTEVSRDVRDGAPLSRALARHGNFPPMMITMIASSEAGGTLPAMLGRFAQDEARSLQARIKALVGLVEPLVLLGMGGVVMLLVLAILLPIVNLNTLVG